MTDLQDGVRQVSETARAHSHLGASTNRVLPPDLQQDPSDPAAVGPSTIANPGAIPLCFRCLRAAALDVQMWCLGGWIRLLRGSMVNLSASDRWELVGWSIDGWSLIHMCLLQQQAPVQEHAGHAVLQTP